MMIWCWPIEKSAGNYAVTSKPLHNESPGTTTNLALWVSRIFHPFAIPVPALFLIMYLSGISLVESLKWSGLAFIIATVPPLTWVAVNVRSGRYTDMDVSVREDRHKLYVIAVLSFVALIVTLTVTDAPRIVLGCIYASLIAVTVGALINRFLTKVSLHAIFMGGSAGVILLISPVVGIIMCSIALLVGWSRIHLNRHSGKQVLLGWSVATICVAIVFVYYL